MKIETVWQSEKQFIATDDKGHSVTIDAQESNGGKNIGQTPAELLVSALGGCMGITMMTSLENYDEGVEELRIKLEGVKSDQIPKRMEKIKLTIHIKTDIKQKVVDRVVKLAHNKYCTISNSINAKIIVDVNYL
ncbi:MAG TPA: OsmC family protein [Alloiococcus sp.]|nr:OsmC family protein [Alloiococcus sp.]